MFCPKCGTLSFPDPSGKITCPNYKCGYVGGAKLVIKGTDGEDVDLFNVKSETKSKAKIPTPNPPIVTPMDGMIPSIISDPVANNAPTGSPASGTLDF